MQRVRSILSRLSANRRRLDAESDEEMRFHLELEIEHNIARGMSPDEARRAAVASFGGVQRYREETRDSRGFAFVDGVVRDARHAVRRLRRAPAYSTGVILTLAIGLGAAGGIGALVYGVMLRPLPYPEPDRLVRVATLTPGLGTTTAEQSSGTYVFFKERARSFESLGAYMENEGVVITSGVTPERVTSAIITPNLLRMLGARPAAGRLFVDEDARVDTLPVMISWDVWQRRFAGDPNVAGQRIEVNRGRRVIVGVLPKGFDFPSPASAIYYPDFIESRTADLNSRYLTVVGRLARGVDVQSAQRELESLIPRFHERFPELTADAVTKTGLTPVVRTLRDATIAPIRAELTLLAIMVGVVLLIAAANVATLSLLRAERLRGEVAVSRALGAGRATMTQRFLVEGVVLSLVSGLLALPIVAVSVATRFGFDVTSVPRLNRIALSPGLAFATLLVALVIGVTIGWVASARAFGGSTDSAADALRGMVRSTGGPGWKRVQEGLVAAQIALAFALLLGAGLMGRSLARLGRVDLGVDAEHGAAVFQTVLPFSAYPTYQRASAFHLEVMDRVGSLPGVGAVAAAMQFPLTEQLLSVHPRLVTDAADGRTREATSTANLVTANYFSVIGIPLRAGRSFSSGDAASATPAVVLAQSLARELFGEVDPVGRQVRIAKSKRYPAYRVVGVVGDVFGARIVDGPLRLLYFPMLPDLGPVSKDTIRIPFVPAGVTYVARTDRPLGTLAPDIARSVRAIDSRVPAWGIRSLGDVARGATARVRLTMLLLSIAAAATLLLGAVGLASVVSYAVSGRAREFAVRLALGATPTSVSRMVLREGVVVAVMGLIAGLVLSLAGTRAVRGLLYQITPTDPLTYIGGALIVISIVAAAMYRPARRAGQSDPAAVLRG